jgi:hypothetical protein
VKSHLWKFFLLAVLFVADAGADQTVHFQGEARIDGQLVYVENHEVLYDNAGRLLEAKTLYDSPAGKPIAEINSDFRESVTVPDHTVRDFRTGNIQGLRRENGAVVLFDQDPGKPERTRSLTEKDAGDRILVGCQGLNYYLLGNLERLDPKAKLPLRFLIPGKLDYYDFNLERTGESADGIVDYEISIQDWFLRFFAPKLYVKYDKNAKHLIWYQGLSNITDEKGDPQNVTITYNYGPPR